MEVGRHHPGTIAIFDGEGVLTLLGEIIRLVANEFQLTSQLRGLLFLFICTRIRILLRQRQRRLHVDIVLRNEESFIGSHRDGHLEDNHLFVLFVLGHLPTLCLFGDDTALKLADINLHLFVLSVQAQTDYSQQDKNHHSLHSFHIFFLSLIIL